MNENNTVEFKLKLGDYASENVKKFGGTAHSVFGGVDNDVAKTQGMMQELGRPVDVQVNTSQAHGAINELAESMHGLSEMKVIGGMAVGELLARGVEKSADFVKEQIKDVLKGGMEESQGMMEMNVLAGSDAVGKELHENITGYLKKSMFGSELFGGAKTLLQMGVGVDDVLPSLKEIGDISMGNSEKMQELAHSFGLVAMTGHLTAREVMMMTHEGFNPLTEISRTTGVAVADLMDKMSKGEITTGMVADAFKSATEEGGKFYHMMARIMDTPAGQYREMVTNIEYAKKELGVALLPAMSHVMDAFRPIIEELPENLEKMRPAMDAWIRDLGDSVKWISNNTATIGKFVDVAKVGVEVWAMWKVGTAAATAVNWLWTASIGAQETAAVTAAAAIETENTALVQQTELAAALATEYEALTLTIGNYTVGLAEAAAAQKAFALPINVAGAMGAQTAAGSAALGAGAGSLMSQAVLPVAIMFIAGEILETLAPKGSFGKDLLTGDPIKWWDFMSRNDDLKHRQGYELPVKKWGDDLSNMFDYHLKDEASKPYQFVPGERKGGGNTDAALSSVSDAIVGGGQKQIIFNNMRFVEKWEQHINGGGKEAAAESFNEFEKMFYMVVEGVKNRL